MHTSDEDLRRNLQNMTIEGVRVLASEPSRQISYFPEFVALYDELARGLSDPLQLIEEAPIKDIFTDIQMKRLKELCEMAVALMPSEPPRIADEKILSMPEWERVRSNAKRILTEFGWDGPLSEGYSKFVPGG